MKKIEVFNSEVHKSQKERICHSCNNKILVGEDYAFIDLDKLKWNERVAICKKCFKLKTLEVSQND